MTSFDQFYHRRPKRLMIACFVLAVLFDLMPFSGELFFWLPEATALMLLYWTLNRPQSVGVGVAFCCGLLIDIGSAGPLAQHALSYMLMTFTVQHYQRQISLHSYDWQSVAVFFALLGNQTALVLIRLIYDHRWAGLLGFIAPFVGALLWPLLNKLMISLLNFRRLRK